MKPHEPDRQITDPEKNLWQQVLLLAISDALYGVTSEMGRKTTRYHLTKEAREYLTTPSKDLSVVCSLAGIDPSAVVERMRKALKSAPKPDDLIFKPSKRQPPTAKPSSSGRRIGEKITFGDQSLTVVEWSKRTGISKATIYFRLKSGWEVSDALTVPNGGRRYARPAAIV